MPLPAGAARSISPGNHLALIAVRAGQTTPDTILTRLRVLYMTFFMSGSDCAADDIELLLTVGTIFNNCILRAAAGQPAHADRRMNGARAPHTAGSRGT
ncbi:hypothetical protein [Paraburkholderia kururiensis]|uniref:hypothetical protein n=1 Tax=Paraburkholderia kururiensis TaxID=984307 RepID=UPI0018F2E8EE|nr:hypothetical protein [Paraburkholderia kururiensis]